MATGNFELHQLRCFVAVATELNFRRAADKLNMTQPPLSRQIQLLEHSIGLSLLERNNRSVRLTPAGVSLLSSATDILQRAEHAILKAHQAERGEIGQINMGFVPSASFEFLPLVVERIHATLPGVNFSPLEMMSYEINEALSSGEIDFGISRFQGNGANIHSEKVISEPFVVAMPKDHPLTEKALLEPQDLNGQPFIGYSTYRGGVLRERHLAFFAFANINPNIVQEVSQTQTVLGIVNCGLGLSLVPQSAQRQRMENLAFRPINLPPNLSSDLYLSYSAKSRSQLQETVKTLIIEVLSAFNQSSLAN